MPDWVGRLAFLAGLVFLSALAGVFSARYQVFPSTLVRDAGIALNELKIWLDLQTRGDRRDESVHMIRSPLTDVREFESVDPEAADRGFTFVSLFRDDEFQLALLDGAGTIVHRWRVPEPILADAGRTEGGLPLRRDQYEIMGAHLYPDGEVLFILSYRLLAKIDRCSNPLWAVKEPANHDMAVLDNGDAWVPTHAIVKPPGSAGTDLAFYLNDQLMRVSPGGAVLEKFSVLDAFLNSDYRGVVLGSREFKPELVNEDPLHLNDVDIIDESFARHHEFAEPGDFLISLRTVDSIAIIDRDSKLVKWALTGRFLRQHDVDALPDGSMLVFDNRTDRAQLNGARHLIEPQRFGYSRVVQFDPETQQTLWQYAGSREHPFYSSIQGDQQALENGRILITDSEGGRVFEIEKATGQVVWSFRNILAREKDGVWFGRISEATRYRPDYPRFLGAPCP